jgi:hypothetical protein
MRATPELLSGKVVSVLSRDPDYILSHLVDGDGKCKICKQDHGYNPTFEDIKTSMDVISELFGRESKPEIMKEVLKQHV